MKRTYWTLWAALAAVVGAGAVPSQAQDAPDSGALFQKLDKNSDGKLTGEEVPEEQKPFFERLVRLGDKNDDGDLTREEFERATRPEERPRVPLGAGDGGRAEARERFEMLDRNKDGKVSLEEVPDQVRDRLKPLFDRAGKQELTFEEFSRLAGGGVRPGPAELFKRFDANSDGKLTKEELPEQMRERLAPAFERAGKNELTLEDFEKFAGREPIGRSGRPMGNPEEMFGRLDTNGDGKLTIDEAPERARPMVAGALRRAGKGEDGSLSKEEFAKSIEQMREREGDRRPEGERPREGDRRPEGRPMEGRGPAFFRILDTNRDGRLSKDELAQAKEMFDELDRNRDGQLDLFEVIGGPGGPPDRRPGQPGREEPQREGERRREGEREAGPRPEGDEANRERRRGAAPIFERLDVNRDGKISTDEMPVPLKDRIGTLDTNGDGSIDLNEFRAGGPQLGERNRTRPPEERPDTPRRD